VGDLGDEPVDRVDLALEAGDGRLLLGAEIGLAQGQVIEKLTGSRAARLVKWRRVRQAA
jgi:hypothetical protein